MINDKRHVGEKIRQITIMRFAKLRHPIYKILINSLSHICLDANDKVAQKRCYLSVLQFFNMKTLIFLNVFKLECVFVDVLHVCVFALLSI